MDEVAQGPPIRKGVVEVVYLQEGRERREEGEGGREGGRGREEWREGGWVEGVQEGGRKVCRRVGRVEVGHVGMFVRACTYACISLPSPTLPSPFPFPFLTGTPYSWHTALHHCSMRASRGSKKSPVSKATQGALRGFWYW